MATPDCVTSTVNVLAPLTLIAALRDSVPLLTSATMLTVALPLPMAGLTCSQLSVTDRVQSELLVMVRDCEVPPSASKDMEAGETERVAGSTGWVQAMASSTALNMPIINFLIASGIRKPGARSKAPGKTGVYSDFVIFA